MDKPKRQHPIWILYQLGKLLKNVALPVILTFLLVMRYDHLFVKGIVLIAVLILLYEVLSIFFRWKNNTYSLHGDMIALTEGRFVTKKRYMALHNMHHIREQTTYLHKLFGTTSITLQTGTNREDSSIKLEMIAQQDAKRIRMLTEQGRNKQANSNMDDNVIIHYKMNFKEIVIISITLLYIVALLSIITSIYYKINQVFSIESYTIAMKGFISPSGWGMMYLFLTLAILTISGGILFTYFRYGSYEVSSDKEYIYIQKGVLHTNLITIPREKINGIIIEKSITRRLFGFIKVKMISVHDHALDDILETNTLFPFIRASRGQQLIEEVLPQYPIQDEMHPLPQQAYFVELIQPSYLLVMITFFTFFFFPEFWFIPLLYVLSIMMKRVLTTKQQKFVWTNDIAQIQTGSFFVHLAITKRDKIDAFVIDQSWVERKLGLASINITLREKPLYIIELKRIRVDDANRFYDWYRQNK